MTTYSLNFTGQIVRSDGAHIPVDENNSDFVEYLAWVAAGNSIAPYVAPAKTWQDFQGLAKGALVSADITVHRIAEGVALGLTTWTAPDVVTYMTYRRALRTIISTPTGTPGTLPAAPAYPNGT